MVEATSRVTPPHGLTWRGYLIQLLHITSSIEHALMVQYLFAAYSLDPSKGADRAEQRMIARWQNLILSIAKEEMGHLLTVQNVLCLLGAPVELARENHPWDSDFYPFPFKLERLTLRSAGLYLYAEMPEDRPELMQWAEQHLAESGIDHNDPVTVKTHQVARLYRYIIEIIGDAERIPDSDFHDDSVRFQASWDDWGRGHHRKPTQLLDSTPHIEPPVLNPFVQHLLARVREIESEPTRADVIVARMRTRHEAIAALTRIADQGESAKHLSGSHFDRFYSIVKDFDAARKKHDSTWEPSHPVADDPHTLLPNEKGSESKSIITWPLAVNWATLFNLRYRMVLTYLSHSFRLARGGNDAALRGAVIHKVFAEMYNLKAIAGILVRLPLKDPSDRRRAGPPFQMPYTLSLPLGAVDRWRLHRDLLNGAMTLYGDLRTAGVQSPEELSFLSASEELDRKSIEWVDHVIAGLGRSRDYAP